MSLWELPDSALIGGARYPIHADHRDILRIFRYLDDRELPESIRWRIAIALFYEGEIPRQHVQEAIGYLVWFITCGRPEAKPGPRLLDWEQDAQMIVADVNRVAGMEIRAVPYLHWWTFMAYFDAITEGQLSMVVTIREKLRTGKKLEKWEQEYYRKNADRVVLKKRYSAEELAEQARLKKLLDGAGRHSGSG